MALNVKPFNLSWKTCPICGIGYLVGMVENNGKLPCHYSECNWCGSETLTLEQSRANVSLAKMYKTTTSNIKA